MSGFIDKALSAAATKALSSCGAIPYLLGKSQEKGHARSAAQLLITTDFGCIAGVQFPLSESPNDCISLVPARWPKLPPNHSDDFSVVTMAPDQWTVSVGFRAISQSFVTHLTIPAPSEEDAILRYELMAVVDCFSLVCKSILETFRATLDDHGELLSQDPYGPLVYAAAILERAIRFSSLVTTAILLDDDGFVLASSDNERDVEQVAGQVALLDRRIHTELTGLPVSAVESVLLSTDDRCLLIGTGLIPGIQAALEAVGSHAVSHVPLIYAFVQSYLKESNVPGMANGSLPAPPCGRHELVTARGSLTFHVSSCTRVTGRKNVSGLCPLSSRAAALLAGLQPCNVCNP